MRPVLPVYAILEEGEPASVTALAFGRKMIAALAAGRLLVQQMVHVLPDGETVTAQRAGKLYRLIIATPSTASAGSIDKSKADIWIPRGFVVYPASDTAPFGWGLPIIQNGALSPYDTENLDPGLEVARWTSGGPLGQVLLVRILGLGLAVDGPNYPKRTTQAAPLFYTPANGLKPKKRSTRLDVDLDQAPRDLHAFRLSHVDVTAFEASDVKPSMRKIFELTNAHRVDKGLDPLSLPLRGFYRTAPQYVKMMEAKGTLAHFAKKFWPTYKVPSDRNGKDGLAWLQDATTSDNRNLAHAIGENNYAQARAASEHVIGTDPNGDDITELQAVGPVNPNTVFDAWLASAPHRATIENALWNRHSTFLDVGVRNGFAAQDFTRRSQWIPCGNAYWYSADTDVPALSWHAPMSMNLLWETWPGAAEVTIPYSGLLNSQPIVDGNGRCWFNYYFARTPDDPAVTADDEWIVPALASAIYMRGRMIACAPHGGLVLGAGAQKIDATTYRLIALVHNEADQITTTDAHGVYTHGATAVLHVYYVDLPSDSAFAMRPESVVRGIHGSPATTDAWIDVDDPWSWRDAGTVRLDSTDGGSTINLLKYSQLWRFSADGTRAVCLRDEATVADWNDTIFTYSIASSVITLGNQAPRTLVLSFGASGGALTVSLEVKSRAPVHQYFLDHPDGIPCALPGVSGDAEMRMFQSAVDFDARGVLVYAYLGFAFLERFVPDQFNIYFAGRGAFGAMSLGDIDAFVYTGCDDNSPVSDAAPSRVQVIDVNDAVIVVDGFRPRFAWDGADTISANPDYVPCWLNNTDGTHSVAVFKGGALQHATWHGNPDGIVSDTGALCAFFGLDTSLLQFDLNVVSALSQASYAKNRKGDWVLTYQHSPQPYVCRVIDTQVVPCISPNTCTPTTFDWAGVDHSGSPTGASHPLAYNEVSPRGGWCTSSFGNQADLAALTNTPGANPRMIYARVV